MTEMSESHALRITKWEFHRNKTQPQRELKFSKDESFVNSGLVTGNFFLRASSRPFV